VINEAETCVMHLQVEEYQGFPITTRSQEKGREDPPLEQSERGWSC
jgi:hypothetical protein